MAKVRVYATKARSTGQTLFFSEGDVLPVGLSVALCQAEVYRVEVAALAAVADE